MCRLNISCSVCTGMWRVNHLVLCVHRDVVCAENAEHLLRAATTLQIKGMITRCEEYLMDNLSEKNCITMWKLGRTHNCEELEDRAWPLILQNFNELSRTDAFQVGSSSGLSGPAHCLSVPISSSFFFC